MTKKSKKILNLIIMLIFVIIIMNLLQPFTYATTPSTEETGISEVTEKTDADSIMGIIKSTIAKWYYVFRYFSIIFMLIVLIFLGIKLAISSIAEEKAKYKRMLLDWIVGFVIIFGIHYFMAGVLMLNDICLSGIEKFSNSLAEKFVKTTEYSLTGASLYETIRTRAYEFSIGIGTSGMVMYMVLVYYTIRFVIIYFKRFFTILILTVMAPIAALSYAFTKVNSGKAQILGKWAEEYTFNIFLQSIHALMYGCFVSTALALSDDSIAGFILALVMLNFMLKAEKIFRKIFKISGKLLDDNADKDIKENLAALTAMTASAKAFTSNGMVKDTTSSIKRGIGAVSNVGLYAGLSAYDKALQFNENRDKDYKKVNEAKEEIKASKTDKEREIAQAKLENLLNSSSKLSAMEGRRNRLKRYKGQNESKTAVGKLINDKNIDKRANALIAKEEEKNGPVSEERQKEIRAQVARKYNDRIKRRTVEFNEFKGKYEVTSGIARNLKADLNTAIWGDANIKNATKAMIGNTVKGISGAAMIMFSVPQIVANPKVGLPLLAKGISNANVLYGKGNYKKVTTLRHRRTIRKNMRKQKGKNSKSEKYSFNRLNSKSLDTVKAQMKMDSASNMIFRINNPSLSVRMFTTPLRLTGALGAMRNIQSYSYQVNEAKKDRYEKIETAFAIEKKNSYSKDFIGEYNNKISKMEKDTEQKLTNRPIEEILLMHKQETGTVFEVNDKKMEFKNNSISSLTQTDLIDNAILKVAVKNRVTDLKRLDVGNQFVQLEVLQELSNLGIVTNVGDIKLDEHQKEINQLMKKISERIDSITKENPEVLKEKLTQVVITEYMQDNGIENPDELKTDEHSENIKQEVLNILEENIPKPQTEEEILDEKIKEIVEKAMETTTTKEELEEVVQNEVSEVLFEFHEKEAQENPTTQIKEELKQRKNKHLPEKTTYTVDHEEYKDTEAITRIVEEQTKIVTESVEDIISQINQDKEQQKAQIDFIDKIISEVQLVEDDKPTLTNKEETELSSDLVIKDILSKDAKREVKKSEEFKELNEQLKKVDEITVSFESPQISDDVIEENITKDNDELIARLLAIKEQDQVAVALKVKEDSSEKKKFMKIDEERFEKIYNYTGIDEVINMINNN